MRARRSLPTERKSNTLDSVADRGTALPSLSNAQKQCHDARVCGAVRKPATKPGMFGPGATKVLDVQSDYRPWVCRSNDFYNTSFFTRSRRRLRQQPYFLLQRSSLESSRLPIAHCNESSIAVASSRSSQE